MSAVLRASGWEPVYAALFFIGLAELAHHGMIIVGYGDSIGMEVTTSVKRYRIEWLRLWVELASHARTWGRNRVGADGRTRSRPSSPQN